MIAYGNVIVIGLQCILRTTIHASNSKSMISTSVEVGVISDIKGQMHTDIFLCMECSLTNILVVPQQRWSGCILRQEIDYGGTNRRHSLASGSSEIIQCRLELIRISFASCDTCWRVEGLKPSIPLNAPPLARTLKSRTKSPILDAGRGVGFVTLENIPKGMFLREKWLFVETGIYDISLKIGLVDRRRLTRWKMDMQVGKHPRFIKLPGRRVKCGGGSEQNTVHVIPSATVG
jgi:hypothetical protein